MKSDPKIVVAIRKRPLTRKETTKDEKDIVDVYEPSELIVKEMRLFN